jgi:hypothetical protein
VNDDVGKTKNLVLKKKRLKVNHKYDVIICIQLKIQIDGIPITVTTFHHSRSTPYWSTRTRTPNPEEKVVNKCKIIIQQALPLTMFRPRSGSDRSYSNTGRPLRRCRTLENQQDPATRTKCQKRAKTTTTDLTGNGGVWDSKENNTVGAANFSSTFTDDLFLHVMTFIVSSENAQVDGTTLRAMACVCKAWETISNSALLWSKANVADKNYRLSEWKDVSIDSGVASALIGFVKVGEVEQQHGGERIYHLRDRATSKMYVLKTRDMVLGCTEQLRELHASHMIMGESFMDAHASTHNVSLPIGVDIQGPTLLTWYRPTQQSLQQWFDTSLNCANPTMRRVPEALPIPLSTLKRWMRDLCTAMIAIYDDANPWNDHRHGFHGDFCPKTILLTDDAASLQLSCPLHMQNGIDRSDKTQLHCRSPDSLQGTHGNYHQTHLNDLWALGCICAQIARCGVPLFSSRSTTCLLRQIHNTVGSSLEVKSTFGEFLAREIPTLGNDGIDFIQKLLHPNFSKRIPPREALWHPFLNDEPPNIIKGPFDVNGREIQRFLAQERLYGAPDPSRYHLDDYQWAALTDWLFEVVEVMPTVRRSTVFQAMAYFERFLSSYGEIPWQRHQLALGACFLLATQVDPNSVPISARDLKFSADNTFDTNDVEVCRRFVLENLKFGLAIPSIANFSGAYLAEIVVDLRSTDSMIFFLSELALQTPMYINFRSSLIAACVIVLGMHTLGQQPLWPNVLAAKTGYQWQDLEDCLIQLSRALENIRISMPQLKMITRRYRCEHYWQVGAMAIPRITSFASLTNEGPERN